MENHKQKIFVAIIIILIILLSLSMGTIYYLQQKWKIQWDLMAQSKGGCNQITEKDMSFDVNAISGKQLIDSVENSAKFIQGKVISVSGNALRIEADILDVEKIPEVITPELRAAYETNPPIMKKTFTVNISSDTQFSANKLSEIKAGDSIKVEAEELVYKTDTLTAVSIESPFEL